MGGEPFRWINSHSGKLSRRWTRSVKSSRSGSNHQAHSNEFAYTLGLLLIELFIIIVTPRLLDRPTNLVCSLPEPKTIKTLTRRVATSCFLEKYVGKNGKRNSTRGERFLPVPLILLVLFSCTAFDLTDVRIRIRMYVRMLCNARGVCKRKSGTPLDFLTRGKCKFFHLSTTLSRQVPAYLKHPPTTPLPSPVFYAREQQVMFFKRGIIN